MTAFAFVLWLEAAARLVLEKETVPTDHQKELERDVEGEPPPEETV